MLPNIIIFRISAVCMLNAQRALIKSQIESAYAYAGGCIDDAALWLQMFVNYISKVAISMWKQNP